MQVRGIKKGDVAVDNAGDVIVITRTEVQSDNPDSQGRIYIFNVGTYLKSNSVPVGSRYGGNVCRVVCNISDLLKLGEANGYDLHTPAEVPDSELTEIQLLQRQVVQLQNRLTTQPSNIIPAIVRS
jgi:hypothetical protein